MQGIYILNFKDVEGVYVGQSVQLEVRKGQHLASLSKHCHSNWKLQDAYDLSKDFNFEVLELVKDYTLLNQKEQEYILEFDSYSNGLNLTLGGFNSVGEQHPASKNSDELMVAILKELAYSNKTLKECAEYFNVPATTIRALAAGRSYSWMENVHPKEYALMKSRLHKRTNLVLNEDVAKSILFDLCDNLNESYTNIADLHGVGMAVVSSISKGTGYTWLQDLYPDKYEILKTRPLAPKRTKSKYSDKQLEQVLDLLSSDTSMKQISKLTAVSYDTVVAIKRKSSYLWLQDLYPEKYNKI